MESYVKYKGSAKDIMFKIEWSLKAGFGYIGAKNLQEAKEKSELVKTSPSVLSRTSFHSIDKLISKTI